MFKIFINDGTMVPPPDNIYYIVGKEGIFLKKKMGLIDSTIKVKQVSILENVEEKANLNVTKIPYRSFSKVIKFYKDIYEQFRSEAVILLYYNESIKRYRVYAPKQNVTSGSGIYKVERTFPGYQLIGTIHSHGSMSAFHSSVDDNDEKHFDGLHITVGRLDEPLLDISCSIVVNEKRFKVNPMNYISGLEEIINNSQSISTYSSIRYKLNSTLYPYNKKWLKRVNKHKIVRKEPEIITSHQFEFGFPQTNIMDEDYVDLLRNFYSDNKVGNDNDDHPCKKCPMYEQAKERFEEDFIDEYDLQNTIDEKDFGDIDLDSLNEITLEYKQNIQKDK